MTDTTNAGTLSEKEGEELFLKAYSELSGEEHKPSEFDEAPVPEEKIEQEVGTENPEPTKEEETPAAKEEKSTSPPPAEEKKPAAPTIEELLNGIPEERQEFVKQLLAERDLAEQRFKSHQGRLAAERRQRQQIEQELLKLRTRGPSSPQDPKLAEQTKTDFAKAIEEWKLVVEAEPTLAKAVDALTDAKVGEVEQRIVRAQEEEKALRERHAYEELRQREWETVLQYVPNVAEVASSQEFKDWKDNIAPPGIKHLAETSIDHRDVLFVLQQYTPYAQWLNEQRNGGTPVKQTPPATDTAVADKISENRQSKSSPVVSGHAPVINVAPDVGNTFDDATAERLFIEAYKKVKSR